jgi:hypothetical protein
MTGVDGGSDRVNPGGRGSGTASRTVRNPISVPLVVFGVGLVAISLLVAVLGGPVDRFLTVAAASNVSQISTGVEWVRDAWEFLPFFGLVLLGLGLLTDSVFAGNGGGV